MSKSLIAIVDDIERSSRMSSNDQKIDYSPRDISRAIFEAGGIPIGLKVPEFHDHSGDSDIQKIAQKFDGLLVPGGPDVDPSFYGEDPIPEIGEISYQRDFFEIKLIKAFYEQGKAIFGICRGLQSINVTFSGTLYQDLKKQYESSLIKHQQYPTEGSFPTHEVNIVKNSGLSNILGNKAFVNSRHHQAVKQVGSGLRIAATGPDGVIEALESEKTDQIIAVQWHPENLWQKNSKQLELFKNFVLRTSRNY
ncbi:gamma-glutamyl-gamma-aminobutyrate hydrolase family protein [Oenococcus alcoholitolerans]|uniref:gamma-glutamyl-gamma-aminobutyrate hydrolase family protein n=1 Tax=Oenococcus alcoholitolerans TaxID=931074 RepID=UPI003F72B3A3